MKCPFCGAETQNDVCEYCGSKVVSENPIQEPNTNAGATPETGGVNPGGCPKCGSSSIKFSREKLGTVSNSKTRRRAVVKGSRGQTVRQSVYRTVGLCQNCGYTWSPDGSSGSANQKAPIWLWVLGWLFIFPVPLTILMLRKKDMKPAIKYGIIAAGWILYLLIAFSGNSSDSNKEAQTVETVEESKTDSSTENEEEKAPPASAVTEVEEVDEEETAVNGKSEEDASEDEKKSEDESDGDYITPEAFVTVAESILEQNFGKDNFNVACDEDGMVNVNVWQDAVSEGAAAIALGNKEILDDWDTMKDGMKSMSSSIQKSYKELTGRDDVVMVSVLNDKNKDNTLMTFVGDTCIYDCVDEYR